MQKKIWLRLTFVLLVPLLLASRRNSLQDDLNSLTNSKADLFFKFTCDDQRPWATPAYNHLRLINTNHPNNLGNGLGSLPMNRVVTQAYQANIVNGQDWLRFYYMTLNSSYTSTWCVDHDHTELIDTNDETIVKANFLGTDRRQLIWIQLMSQCHTSSSNAGNGIWWKGERWFAPGDYPIRRDQARSIPLGYQGITSCTETAFKDWGCGIEDNR